MTIYEESKAQWEKVKHKGPKAILSYFKTYYLLPTIVIIAIVVGVIYIVYTSVTSLPYGFYGMLVNAGSYEQEAISQEFTEYASLDPTQEDIYVDASTSMDLNGTSQYDMGTVQKVATVMMAGDLDIFGANYDVFANYAGNGNFSDLREVLSPEQIERYEDYFYYVDMAVIRANEDAIYGDSSDTGEDTADAEAQSATADTDVESSGVEAAGTGTASESADASHNIADASDASAEDPYSAVFGNDVNSSYGLAEDFVAPDPSTMEEPVPVGIILSDAPYLEENSLYIGTVAVVGIPQNAPRMEAALKFIDFLFQE